MNIKNFIKKLKSPFINNNDNDTLYVCGENCGCDQQFFNVYLAGPIRSKTYKEATVWRNYVASKLDPSIRILTPMRGAKDTGLPIHRSDYYDQSMNSDEGIYNRDSGDVRMADALFVNFLCSDKISFGTGIEIGIADEMNIPIIVCIDPENIHNNPMMNGNKNITFVKTLDDGIKIINDMFTKPAFLNEGGN